MSELSTREPAEMQAPFRLSQVIVFFAGVVTVTLLVIYMASALRVKGPHPSRALATSHWLEALASFAVVAAVDAVIIAFALRAGREGRR